MKAILCIGGLDPSGRAGLLADARAVEAMGGRAICVASALTFQSTLKGEGFSAVDAETLQKQLDPVLRDEGISAIKVGQIGSLANARVVAAIAFEGPFVVDTPLVSSRGMPLLEPAEVALAYALLMKRATLVTPNLPEFKLLSNAAASAPAHALGAAAVLVKGGHGDGARIVDVLSTLGELHHEFSGPRIEGRFRGTGCRLASAIAVRLAERDDLVSAIGTARHWLTSRLLAESRGKP